MLRLRSRENVHQLRLWGKLGCEGIEGRPLMIEPGMLLGPGIIAGANRNYMGVSWDSGETETTQMTAGACSWSGVASSANGLKLATTNGGPLCS